MTATPSSGSPAEDQPADTSPGPTWGSRLRRVPAGVWLALVLAVIAIVFIAQNRNRVELQLAGYAISAPLWLLTGTILVLGMLIGMLLSHRSRAEGTSRGS